jgi:hypothetical protein
MPAIVIAAFANDLNPAIDAQRRLMARWSPARLWILRRRLPDIGATMPMAG